MISSRRHQFQRLSWPPYHDLQEVCCQLRSTSLRARIRGVGTGSMLAHRRQVCLRIGSKLVRTGDSCCRRTGFPLTYAMQEVGQALCSDQFQRPLATTEARFVYWPWRHTTPSRSSIATLFISSTLDVAYLVYQVAELHSLSKIQQDSDAAVGLY